MKKILLLLLITSFFSCDDVIDLVDISSTSVIQLAPVTDAVLDSTTPITFTWNTMADVESYLLQIATPDFATATQIISDTILTTTNFTKDLPVAAYQWRVKAKNSNYETGFSTRNFTVQ